MTSFADNFWGEKNNGFDILYHNMKYGQDSSKELADFLRESCSVEENYAKMLAKLARYCSNCSTRGSFGPFWGVLKTLVEKLSNLHQQLVLTWQDLMKDVQKYNEEQHKKHKSMKDSESSTLETVQSIQATIVALQKAKETYHARCIEYEKLKRENGTLKDLEKAEVKFRKSNDDYRALVDKYANVRNEFDEKMTDSCQRFQQVEEQHLQKMKEFVDVYAKAWAHQHVVLGQLHQEFRVNESGLTIEKLIGQFIEMKGTGTEKPGPIEFEEADLSSLPPAQTGTPDTEKKDFPGTLFPVLEKPKKEGGESNMTQTSSETGSKALDRSMPGRGSSGWFLSKRRKEKKKKKKEKNDKDKPEEMVQTPQVDEEGFSIRPENPMQNHADRDSWYSSSDSDSDDGRQSKIKVEIKPFSPNGSAPTGNVDDIRKSIEGLRLSPTSGRRQTPTPTDANMKRSASVSDTLANTHNSGKASQDLLSLDILATMSSSASTPTGGRCDGFVSSAPGANVAGSAANPNQYMDRGTGSPEVPPVLPAKQRSHTPTAGAPLLMGPPPSRATHRSNLTSVSTARPAGRQSPAPSAKSMERTDSVPSINNVAFTTTSGPFGSSRGPSPLTIGMSETIPLAVAFSETANVLFKGTTDKCMVKLTGDLMLSFPAGIVRVLTENPSPALLSFRIKNTAALEDILVHKQLMAEDYAQSTSDCKVYAFDMPNLIEHLRRQSEKNKAASYFNIDILKYQVKNQGLQHVPLCLMSYWKCETNQTDYRLDYRYCGPALATPAPLSNVTVMVPVDGDVSSVQSMPTATWTSESKRAVWKLGDLSSLGEGGGTGCLRAKFELNAGPSTPSGTAVQFVCEGTTLSGVDFELVGAGYRISLVKKRLITGKYISEADVEVKYV